MHIILYHCGAAGDMVASMIDGTDYLLNEYKMVPINDRVRIVSTDYTVLDEQFQLWQTKYKCIATQDFQYVLDRNYDFIYIDSSYDDRLIEWTLRRAEKTSGSYHGYNPDLIKKQKSSSRRIKKFTDKIIDIADILNGNLLARLNQLVDFDIDTESNRILYKQWQENALGFMNFSDIQSIIGRSHHV